MTADLSRPLVVRQLVDPSLIAQLLDHVELTYLWAGQSPDLATQDALKWGGLALDTCRPGIDSLIAPVEEAIGEHFGGRLIDEFSVFRRVTRDTYIYWHMDADGTGSWRRDPVWNCWLPLTEVGIPGWPSLEVMPDSGAAMRAFGPNSPGHRSDEWVAQHFAGHEVICPQLDPGDALVFSHWLLHRTQPMEKLAGPRIGAEMRFTVGETKKPWWRRVFG